MLVYRRWLQLVCGPGTRPMFREFHRAPPRLVFLGNKVSSNCFAPTSSVRPPAPRRPRRLGSAPLAGVVGRHLGFCLCIVLVSWMPSPSPGRKSRAAPAPGHLPLSRIMSLLIPFLCNMVSHLDSLVLFLVRLSYVLNSRLLFLARNIYTYIHSTLFRSRDLFSLVQQGYHLPTIYLFRYT